MRKAKQFVVTDVNYGFVHHVQMLQMHTTNFYPATFSDLGLYSENHLVFSDNPDRSCGGWVEGMHA